MYNGVTQQGYVCRGKGGARGGPEWVSRLDAWTGGWEGSRTEAYYRWVLLCHEGDGYVGVYDSACAYQVPMHTYQPLVNAIDCTRKTSA